ncbi:MAG: hypothetical protein IPM42_14100 [Saprospiraceae bacterium]|jgi:hypothetical protein|nr:hypothetical protein [Saprospiraceae bacterium]
MKNRNLFFLLVAIVIVAPAIHYFIAGENYNNTSIRNILVGIQILVGVVLLVVYGRKNKNSEKTK